MYVETDFLVALIKEDDWLTNAAEKVYEEHSDEIWTSHYAFLELLMVSYKEGWDCLEVVSNAEEIVDVRADVSDIKSAALHVEEDGMTPMDAIHLVSSEKDKIISRDKSYDQHTERLKLEEKAEEMKECEKE